MIVLALYRLQEESQGALEQMLTIGARLAHP